MHGEHWRARGSERIEPGEEVEVEGIHGLTLKVRKAVNREFYR